MIDGRRLRLAAVAAAVLAGSPVAAGPLEDGVAAYESGAYDRAMALLLPLAEAAEPEAQFLVGQMHDFGQGVVQDDSTALTWYFTAARMGHGGAQFGVARMLDSGEGLLQRFVDSYAWASIAADQGVPGAAAHRDLIGSILSARELVRAKEDAIQFWQKYVVPFQAEP